MNRNIICIDLKSFFASVECIDKGLFQYVAEEEISSNMDIKKEKIENEFDNLEIQEDDFL